MDDSIYDADNAFTTDQPFELIPASPFPPGRPQNLTQGEADAFAFAYPDESLEDYNANQVRQMLMDAYQVPGSGGLASGGPGYQDLGPRIMREKGVPEDYGCNMAPTPYNEARMTVDHSAAYVPLPLRMVHRRLGSGLHVAMRTNVIVLQFANKKSCAAFCRSWNALISHIGSANEFLPGDVIQAFANQIIEGSGKFGIENQYSPPLRGRVAA